MLSVLLILILLSNHDKYNGALLCLSIVLVCFTDFSAQECKWMLNALGSAVIAAFFVIQGLAFIFRPFDSQRYLGMYANTNMNALFYQMVYCVFLAVFCVLEVKKAHRIIKWVCFSFACAMWAFVLLTMCRSAALGMAAATLTGYGVTLWKYREKRMQKGLVYIGGTLLVSILSFPIVYSAVRYLPAVFHHPIWFQAEYSEDKVHSWDAFDSEKYTDWQEVLQVNFDRLFPWLITAEISQPPDYESVVPPSPQDMSSEGVLPEETLPEEPLPEEPLPEIVPPSEQELPESTYAVSARVMIYQSYLSRLNLRGHTDSENGIQIDENYYAPHAHNVILQYAFNYGILAGIVLFIYLTASGIRFLFLCVQDNTNMFLLPALLFVSIAVYGMTELIWRYGQLSHTLLLLLPCFVWKVRADRLPGQGVA